VNVISVPWIVSQDLRFFCKPGEPVHRPSTICQDGQKSAQQGEAK
jgi:hypothetical protein